MKIIRRVSLSFDGLTRRIMIRLFSLLLISLSLSQCSSRSGVEDIKRTIIRHVDKGEFALAESLIDSMSLKPGLEAGDQNWLKVKSETMRRIRLDFSKSEEQVKKALISYYPDLTDSLLRHWEQSGHLEMRTIDGTRKYFNQAVPNLFRVDKNAAKVKSNIVPPKKDPLDSICLNNIAEIISTGSPGSVASALRITFEYTLTVDADAVPAGESINCWMPFPRTCLPRQSGVNLIRADPAAVKLSDSTSIHSSIFATQIAVAGKPAVFTYQGSYEIAGQWFGPLLSGKSRKPTTPNELDHYTQETLPHIAFTPLVVQLADSLSKNLKDDYAMLKRFFIWIDANIPWASALEYSTFECIPDYVIKYRKGDCGMKTFLLMSMLRYKGVPVRWQSGWMLHPGQENLHDWCEVWLDQAGWIPVDISFGLQDSEIPDIRNFYINGIDSYRMIVNEGIAGNFNPVKKHYRSEPFDFQRGEVEWKGGNIYFNQWDYHLHVQKIEKINR